VSGRSQDPLPAVIERDTVLTSEGSPYYIQQNVSISSNITLKIKEGSQIILSNGVTLTNNGRLIIEGSEDQMVLFTSDAPGSRWNQIVNQGSFFANYLMVRRGVRFVTSYGDTLIVHHCDVADTYGGVGDDCIGVHDADKVDIRYTSLTGNPESGKTDAIDLDGISGDTILGNIIKDYSDDGIDIGTNSSDIVIGGNLISSCNMAVSIGENTTAFVYGNLLLDSDAGIQSHTGSVVHSQQNTLYGNIFGIRAFHDDGQTTTGGTIYVSNTIISNCIQGELIQVDNSQVYFDYNLTDQVLLSGTGNIAGNPRFLDPINGNFHLTPNSDAIDAGNPDLDSDGLDYLVDEDDRDPDGTRLDLGCYPYFQSPVRFVEVSPSNLSLETDAMGEYTDWFKIQNLSDSPFNLNGHFLSDNSEQPYKYRIMEDLYIPAGDTLQLWADDRDDLALSQVPFKLSGSGETLLLSTPTGILMEKREFPRVPMNYVYRKNENTGEWGYSTWPAGEGATTYDSLSRDPVFDNPGGASSFPLTTLLSSSIPSDSIYYTIDGSDPRQGLVYSAALEIPVPTTLRSVILKENHLPGYPQAAAYFQQDHYQLPVLSLSANEEDLFGPTGIYTNYANSGPLWERPVSFSYYGNDRQFSAISGIRIQGGNSIYMPKKAFRLFFRGGYGTPALKSSPFRTGPSSFKNLVLRSGYDDDISTSTGTLLRDPFSTELWKKLGELVTESDFGVLLLNNSYWGIYNIRESINEYFVEDHMGIRDFDMVRFQKWGPELKYGSWDEWNRMVSFFDTADFSLPATYNEVSSFMDLNSLLNLLSLVHCSQYRSWTWGAFAIKPRGGRWSWTIWDTDRAYNIPSWNGFAEYANTSAEKWPNFIPQKLLLNEQFRIELINRNCDLLNSLFFAENAIAVYDSLVTVLTPEMDAEFERWNPGNRDSWEQNNESVRNFIRQRPSYLYDQMKSYFQIEDTVRIHLRIEGRGKVKLNSLIIDQESWEGIYMNGVPITLEAWPDEGVTFVEWRGISTLHRIETDPATAFEIVAVFDSAASIAREPIVINEIMYHPENKELSEWIELYNPNDFSVSLNGFQFTDGGLNNLFSFKPNDILDPLGFLMVAGNSEQFLYQFGANIYLTGSFNSGESGFMLSNEGETLLLKNEKGELEDIVRYSNRSPWPPEADGKGPSLQLISPELDNNLYSSWYTSSGTLFTPGSPNGGTSAEGETPVQGIDLLVYPNPMDETIYIELTGEPGSSVHLSIYTLTGSLVNSALFHSGGGHETLSWQHELKYPGAYIMKVMVQEQERIREQSVLLIYSGQH
jgi:hypothetical protein